MSGQPQFLTNESPDLRDQDPPSPEVPDAVTPQRITSITYGRATPIWLQRISLFVLVLFCVYLGVLVMVLPWWSRIWDHNALMDSYPLVAAFLRSGAVRGIISGIGLLDIWIGISEAVHYRDYRG
jgi:hypothetical protein